MYRTTAAQNKPNSKEMSQSSIRMFVSTVDFEDGEPEDEFPNNHRNEDSEVQRRQYRIVQKLLKQFDMEKTMEHYGSQNIVEYEMHPHHFSSDCSLSTNRVRQRLLNLMGTDIVRLNDRKYFEKLSSRLQEEYESNMDKKEHELAVAEEERVRHLMLEGVIPMPDDASEHAHGQRTRRKSRRRRHRRKRQTSSPGPPSQDTTTYTVTTESDEEESGDHRKDIITQIQIVSNEPPHRPPRSSTSSPSPSHKSYTQPVTSVREHHRNQDTRNNSDDEKEKYHEEEEEDEWTSKTADDYKLDRCSTPRQSKFGKPETPMVRKLREEETVSGLYEIAEKLVVTV